MAKITKAQTETPASGSSGPPWVLIGGVAAVVAIALVALYPRQDTGVGNASGDVDTAIEASEADMEPPAFTPPVVPTRAASPAHPEDVPLPALPAVPNMVPRSPEVVTAAYEFAARNPDILEYVPCFCGCDSAGHTGNADCFVQSRNEDGSVQSWEPHGMACLVCIDVARDAMQLHASGGSVRDIRSAVDGKYLPRATRQTPTPAPPSQ